ncbi:MAG TPA: MlaD family protein [Longimicrobiales bacterium]|nr:MlaD family protein [Longimicrobiales bacterium]
MIAQARGRSAVRVGFFTLLGAAAFATLFVYSTNRVIGAERAHLYIRFDAADGLQRGDAVLHRGVNVGEVKSIDFGSGGVVVHVRLSRAVPFSSNARAEMVAADIFGRQSIVLRGDRGGPPLANRDTLHGRPPVSLTTRFDNIGERIGDLLSKQTVADLRDVLTGAGNAANGAGEAAHDVASLARTAQDLLAGQERALASMTDEAGALLRNLRESTHPDSLGLLRRRLADSGTNLASATATMDTAATSLMRILEGFESGDGSLSRLLHDPALHEHTITVLASLDRLINDVRENPKRYVTIRVF